MRKLFATLLILASLFAPVAAMPVMAHAVNVFPLCTGSSEGKAQGVSAKSTAICGSEASGSSTLLVTTLKTIFDILSFIIGVAAVIMLVIGGLKLISSQGDPANVKSGRDTIIYSLVGLAAAALAQVIVVFVLNKLN